MWCRALSVLALAVAAAGALAACGGGNASSKTPASNGPVLSDEAYLKAICTGTKNFSDALISKTTAAGIGEVVSGFKSEMQSLNPPTDLQDFNTQFVKYLDDSLKDPTSLLTRKPPAPPSKARDRLVSKETNVPECHGQETFFDAQAEAAGSVVASPTP
jgi:hypothetical protein